MSEEFGREHMTAVLKKCEDRIETALKEFNATLGSIPYGQKRGGPRDAVEQFNGMVKAFPPEDIRRPDGTAFKESPMILAQTLLDIPGAKDFLREYRAAMRKLPLEELTNGY